MMSRWRWLLSQLTRRLWMRVTVLGMLGVAAAAAGLALSPYVPESWSLRIGSDAIDGILQVLASSMLAVTVFSLSTMVAAYSAAASTVTPRATTLLVEDNTSQNVLGTFVGAFLFSLAGIIALSTGLYGAQGRAILLVATVLLIVVIAATILTWIDYLSHFGRVGESIDRVERATGRALQAQARHPHLGGRPLQARAQKHEGRPVFSRRIGYVQHVDVAALQACAEAHGAEVILLALPGRFVDPAGPVALTTGAAAGTLDKEIEAAFTIEARRSFDQDPRFGLVVLAEIASRALSPAVNDPGTAIDVIGRAVRLLLDWAREAPDGDDDAPTYPRVWVPALSPEDMLDDVFAPIARDGSALLEVQLRLQKAFRALVAGAPAILGDAARRHSRLALERADADLTLDTERDRVRAMADAVANA